MVTPKIIESLFGVPADEPNYAPAGVRPGGFQWGEGQRIGGAEADNENAR